MQTTKLKEHECPSCGHKMNAATAESGAPKPGDLTICVYCRTFMRFDEDMGAQILTEDEIFELEPEVRAGLIRAREELRDGFELPDDAISEGEMVFIKHEFRKMGKIIQGILSSHGFYDENIKDVGISADGVRLIVGAVLCSDMVTKSVENTEVVAFRAALSRAYKTMMETKGGRNNIVEAMNALLDEYGVE